MNIDWKGNLNAVINDEFLQQFSENSTTQDIVKACFSTPHVRSVYRLTFSISIEPILSGHRNSEVEFFFT